MRVEFCHSIATQKLLVEGYPTLVNRFSLVVGGGSSSVRRGLLLQLNSAKGLSYGQTNLLLSVRLLSIIAPCPTTSPQEESNVCRIHLQQFDHIAVLQTGLQYSVLRIRD